MGKKKASRKIEAGRGYEKMSDAQVAGDLIRRYGEGPISDGLKKDYNLDDDGNPLKK